MNSRLDEISDWDARVRTARWQAKALARTCGLGVWELRHYIRHKFKLPLHGWIRGKRMELAKALLREGMSVKEAASNLGYKTSAHFSHDFKSFYGVSPSAFRLKALRSRQDHRF